MLPFLALATTMASAAELPPLQKAAINLKVRPEQISNTGSNWKTSWGSFSADYVNKRVLVVNLAKLGDFDPNVVVKWYFIGRNESGQRVIYDKGERSVLIAPGGSEIAIVSKTITQTRSRENTPSQTRSATAVDPYGNIAAVDVTIPGKTGPLVVKGLRPDGWCIYIVQGKRDLYQHASTPELIAWTDKELLRGKAKRPSK